MRPAAVLRAILLTTLVSSAAAQAQEPVAPLPPEAGRQLPLAAPGEPYKLHVYARLLQIATVIRDSDKTVPTGLTRDRVKISLDEGPLFSPTFLRQQGQDPIALSIVIDATGSQKSTVAAVAQALPELVPETLVPGRDTLSLFAVDCTAFRTRTATMATPDSVSARLSQLFNANGLHGAKSKGACANSLHLWDTAASAIDELGNAEGRRVLLIVSQGDDLSSKLQERDLSLFAAERGVAVFALRDHIQHDAERSLGSSNAFDTEYRLSHGVYGHPGDPLADLVGRNGGLVYETDEKEIPETLTSFFQTLRERYILEFTAPTQAESGSHSITVTVPGLNGLIRAAGSSAPLPDPATLTDPTTLPTKPSEATFGTKRPATTH